MKYKIEFELPDNETVLKEIKTSPVKWAVWGYTGYCIAKPIKKNKERQTGGEIVAEFQEVMKQWRRMCADGSKEYSCQSCKMYSEIDESVKNFGFSEKLTGNGLQCAYQKLSRRRAHDRGKL